MISVDPFGTCPPNQRHHIHMQSGGTHRADSVTLSDRVILRVTVGKWAHSSM
jgi:hypothetical protein